MTSTITSLFTSTSSKISARLESLCSAETSLISFSHLFNGSDSNILETIDTLIPVNFYPLPSSCPLFPSNPPDRFNIHAIKAKNSDKNSSSSSTEKAPLVLLHGYSNSCLYFYRNIHGLVRHFQTLYAVDLLGWGLSSRPSFPTGDLETSEDFFVESLEAWRKAQNVDKMVLGGHSMGGYISVAYSERYPERVERLILISPVGVPDEDKNPVTSTKEYPLRFRLLLGTMKMFWKAGWTPAGFLRTFTEYRGRSMVEGYIRKRVPAIDSEEEVEALTEYLYGNAVLPGSGEYCLNEILKPGAYARSPLIHRIPKLRVKHIDFIYGKNDWMDPTHGYEVKELCEKSGPDVEVHLVDGAGHLLMLENWKGFNNAMILADSRKSSGI